MVQMPLQPQTRPRRKLTVEIACVVLRPQRTSTTAPTKTVTNTELNALTELAALNAQTELNALTALNALTELTEPR